MRVVWKAFVLAAVLSVEPAAAGASQPSDPLEEAKELYASAEYDKALVRMQDLDHRAITADQARDQALYQALCFLALGNDASANDKIEKLVRSEPMFKLAEDMPPRLGLFVDAVRTRIRPALAQEHYKAGRERLAADDYQGALEEFTLVAELIEEADDRSQLTELYDLATGFRDLARRNLMLAKPAAYAATLPERKVVPPVPIRQNVPVWSKSFPSGMLPMTLLLDIVVSPSGDVQSAKLVTPTEPGYAVLLLTAAKQWKYRPATEDGRPVEFTRRVHINVLGK